MARDLHKIEIQHGNSVLSIEGFGPKTIVGAVEDVLNGKYLDDNGDPPHKIEIEVNRNAVLGMKTVTVNINNGGVS